MGVCEYLLIFIVNGSRNLVCFKDSVGGGVGVVICLVM